MTRISNPQESELEPTPQPSNGKTVLIAEDDPFISRMYQTKLVNAGYTVTAANNGRDAYEKIKASPPDLIMMDINMPELTGFDVVRALKSENAVDISTIIVLTNSADPQDRKTADDLGLDYLVKAEMTPQQVLDKINHKLGLS